MKKKTTNLSRREFLKNTGLVMAGSGLLFSGLSGSVMAAGQGVNRKKALVFIMLDGGNDSYNMLVPTSSDDYRDYQRSRGNLALDKKSLLKLKGFSDKNNKDFGLHSSMPEIQKLFEGNKLSFISNIGPMIDPVSKASFNNNTVQLPVGLMSHSDQFRHWQTSRPGERVNRGWFGAFADKLQEGAPDSQLPMNVSMAGSNVMQDGVDRTSYAITDKGSVGMVFKDSDSASDQTMQYFNQLVESGVDSILSRSYKDPFKQTYASFTRQAQKHHETFSRATQDIRVNSSFSDKKLSRDLKMVARTIKAADRLGMPQQTFFLRYIGWDHHDELLKNHERKLKIVSQAMSEFQQALEELNVADQVITFTGSDFGRSLTSNGNGTDHGWGGNTMIMGEGIHGGQIFGEYPSLALGSDLEVSDGILIPTTSTDQLYAELAMWFGLKKKDLPRLFPNIENFLLTGK